MKTLHVFWIFLVVASLSSQAASLPLAELNGSEISGGKPVGLNLKGRKGVVVVFLSAVCPCSNSHVPELSALAKEYPDFAFVGVHANTNEKKEESQKYFREAKLPFPVIQDNGAKIADAFKANKTPHAYVLLASGEVAYAGGVSDSSNFAHAERKYLRDALEDLHQGRSVKVAEARTLGCSITRGGNNVW